MIKKFARRSIGTCYYIYNYLYELKKRSRIIQVGSPASKSLIDKGYWVFPDKLPPQVVSTLSDEFDELRKSCHLVYSGQLNRRVFAQGPITPTIYKLGNIILDYFPDLFDQNYAIEISYFQESIPENTLDNVPGGRFHVDDNKANFKYFIYLTDVSYENGPFSAVPGTGNWRLKGSFWRGLFWEITRIRYFLYSFLINYKHYEGKDLKFIGSAGTHFIVDTTSLHRDNAVIVGKRLLACISLNKKAEQHNV